MVSSWEMERPWTTAAAADEENHCWNTLIFYFYSSTKIAKLIDEGQRIWILRVLFGCQRFNWVLWNGSQSGWLLLTTKKPQTLTRTGQRVKTGTEGHSWDWFYLTSPATTGGNMFIFHFVRTRCYLSSWGRDLLPGPLVHYMALFNLQGTEETPSQAK